MRSNAPRRKTNGAGEHSLELKLGLASILDMPVDGQDKNGMIDERTQ